MNGSCFFLWLEKHKIWMAHVVQTKWKINSIKCIFGITSKTIVITFVTQVAFAKRTYAWHKLVTIPNTPSKQVKVWLLFRQFDRKIPYLIFIDDFMHWGPVLGAPDHCSFVPVCTDRVGSGITWIGDLRPVLQTLAPLVPELTGQA